MESDSSSYKQLIFKVWALTGPHLAVLTFAQPIAPLNTKLTLMDCGIGNTNLIGCSSSGLGYDWFYMKSTDGATMYFNLGSGIGSGRFQTDYWVKLREKDEK